MALLVLTIAGEAIVFAQNGIAGRVVSTSGQPISGVSVTMLAASGGLPVRTTTGADGTYRFDKVPDGRYRVDFELRGFDVTRRNWVVVRNGTSAFADATMRASGICECVVPGLSPTLVTRSGRVLDSEGRPLPRARLEIVAPLPGGPGADRAASPTTWREVAYTDSDGRFSVRAPLDMTWPVTASDSGFRPVTQQVSGSATEPIVFRLAFSGGGGLLSLPEFERFEHGCRCSGDLFAHAGR